MSGTLSIVTKELKLGVLPEAPVAVNHPSSLPCAKDYIFAIDFTNIINTLVNRQGWKREHAVSVSKLYRRYLFLCRKYGTTHKLPPTEEIDEFWHHHILDTQQYHQDCQAIFGKYFHHYPYFGVDVHSTKADLNRAFAVMLQLYEQEFGEPLVVVRSHFSTLKAYLKRFYSEINH